MRLDDSSRLASAAYAALAALLLATPLPALAQSAGSLEARVKALEARVAAIESRAGAGTPAAAPTNARAAGPACTRLNVNASQITPGTTLTVTVNGTTVATYDENAYGDLEPFMQPGPNTIGLSFDSAGSGGANAELRCLPPSSRTSRTVVLRLKPTAKRLSAQAVVILTPE